MTNLELLLLFQKSFQFLSRVTILSASMYVGLGDNNEIEFDNY